jgi:hypothetical protein
MPISRVSRLNRMTHHSEYANGRQEKRHKSEEGKQNHVRHSVEDRWFHPTTLEERQGRRRGRNLTPYYFFRLSLPRMKAATFSWIAFNEAS